MASPFLVVDSLGDTRRARRPGPSGDSRDEEGAEPAGGAAGGDDRRGGGKTHGTHEASSSRSLDRRFTRQTFEPPCAGQFFSGRDRWALFARTACWRARG